MTSIRRHLLAWLLGTLTLGAVLLALASYAFTLDELNGVFDDELKQVALAALTHHSSDSINRDTGRQGEEFAFVTQVWNEDGARLFVSSIASDIPFDSVEGFQTVNIESRPWRVYTVRAPAGFVQAAQPLEVRRELAAKTAAKLLIPSMLMVPLIAALLHYALRRGLVPLQSAAADIGRRSAASLDPIPGAALPDEIRPLVGSINTLMQRLSLSLASQRQFIADAAHELRTPLTALRLQVQLVENALSAHEREHAVADLRLGIERASRLVAQLLDLSRLEPDGAEHRPQALDLAALARAVVGELSVKADAKRIDLGAEAQSPVPLLGDTAALRLLITNLTDNALRYTPAGGRIDVKALIEPTRAVLEVCDDGPGIPAEEHARVFDRFYRAASATEQDQSIPGTGLGLAIVKAVADRHGATLTLGVGIGGRGLSVRVAFPVDAATANGTKT